jgi:NADPH2:quinone reductase
VPPFNISRLAGKNIKLMRSTVFQYVATQEEFAHWTRELFDIIVKEKINVRIHKIYPLAEATRAHTDLEGRKTTGKLLLKP